MNTANHHRPHRSGTERRRSPRRLGLALLTLAAISCGGPGADDSNEKEKVRAEIPRTAAAAMPSFADVAARVLPAVVSISTERMVPASDAAPDPFSAPPRDELMRGAGSGFIVSGEKAAGGPIEQDGSRAVTVDLQPGTYTVHCPILNHREKGELASFTVRG